MLTEGNYKNAKPRTIMVSLVVREDELSLFLSKQLPLVYVK